ncbi:MAG: class I tRNA ligase family protein, partial [Planctomycetes bacterium]|nr:class I tRNA ligase family protein [Planctomycetota bacterium]
AHKYFDGKVPLAGDRDDQDRAHLERCRQAIAKTADELEAFRFKAALAEVMALARAGNGYFDATKPFLSRKTDMIACGRALNICLQTARTLTTISAPFLPFTAEKCAKILNLDGDYRQWAAATTPLADGHGLGEPEILVRKLDAKELLDD